MSPNQSRLRMTSRFILVLAITFLGLFFALSYAVRSHRISSSQRWLILIPVVSAFIGLIVRQSCLPITTQQNLEGLLKTFSSSTVRSFKMLPWLVLICFATAWLLLPFTPRLAMPVSIVTLLISRQLWIAKLERDKRGRWPRLQLLSITLMPVVFFLSVQHGLDLAISLTIGIYAFLLTVHGAQADMGSGDEGLVHKKGSSPNRVGKY